VQCDEQHETYQEYAKGDQKLAIAQDSFRCLQKRHEALAASHVVELEQAITSEADIMEVDDRPCDGSGTCSRC
jgi:hypothetical protein